MLQRISQNTPLLEQPDHHYDFEDISTPVSISKKYPDLFTDSQMDWMLKIRHKNGLNDTGAVLKISRKLYLVEPLFMKWFMNQKSD